jgi:uncharacterized Zn-binding protein involved in type VI secretion
MPAATRIGDADVTHCSTPFRAQGSPDVMVNGIPWSRLGDNNTVHLKPCPCPPCCCPHAMPIAKGSATVIVNGRGAGRIGDPIAACTSVAQGSSNVFAGG